jgi:hypothetical protein
MEHFVAFSANEIFGWFARQFCHGFIAGDDIVIRPEYERWMPYGLENIFPFSWHRTRLPFGLIAFVPFITGFPQPCH